MSIPVTITKEKKRLLKNGVGLNCVLVRIKCADNGEILKATDLKVVRFVKSQNTTEGVKVLIQLCSCWSLHFCLQISSKFFRTRFKLFFRHFVKNDFQLLRFSIKCSYLYQFVFFNSFTIHYLSSFCLNLKFSCFFFNICRLFCSSLHCRKISLALLARRFLCLRAPISICNSAFPAAARAFNTEEVEPLLELDYIKLFQLD